MADNSDNEARGQDRISVGVSSNELLRRTLAFIQEQLAGWRDRPDRRPQTAERKLNAQFCKHLNSRARFEFPLVLFHHEEDQAIDRRVDISAGLSEGAYVGALYYSIDDPFLVIEGKRLPPPGGKSRAREYVTGGAEKSGGIQRFKLRLHGGDFDVAVIIGFIQKGDVAEWHDRINGWIRELSETLRFGGESWSSAEQLTRFESNSRTRTSVAVSTHPRDSDGSEITIHHFWVEMRPRN